MIHSMTTIATQPSFRFLQERKIHRLVNESDRYATMLLISGQSDNLLAISPLKMNAWCLKMSGEMIEVLGRGPLNGKGRILV